ncbi:MAG TPA: hypothetical protein VMS64_37845 [Candidatus Methylomirabilis sp.]|nr:hypothetical protein [Candidatus Methylomirabilis sp.]
MRFGTLIRWVVFLAVLAWAGYTAIGLGLSYFSVQEMIDTALREASAKHRAAFAAGSQVSVDTLLESVRAAILLAALHDGLRIDRENVSVSANQAGLSATVHWSVPIVSYQGTDAVVVPLLVQRSLTVER